MNDLRDPLIESHYREASDEQPGAARDAAILALAGKVAAQSRAPAAAAPAGAMRRWRAPLAWAASVVLAFGIVSRIVLEEPDGGLSNKERADEALPAPARAQPTDTRAANSRATEASGAVPAQSPPTVVAPSAESVGKSRATAPGTRAEASAGSTRERKQAEPFAASPATPSAPPPELATQANSADRVMAPPSAARSPEPPPVATAEMSQRPVGSGAASGVFAPAPAPVAAPALGTLSAPAPASASGAGAAPAASGEMGSDAARVMKSAQRTARDNAGAAPQGASAGFVPPILSEAREAVLLPQEWISYIVDLRRRGANDAADASLKRFRARYPAHPVSAEASGPETRPSVEPK